MTTDPIQQQTAHEETANAGGGGIGGLFLSEDTAGNAAC